MQIFSKREIQSSLENKGFYKKPTHHNRYIFEEEGCLGKINTKVSHGPSGSDVPKPIMSRMAEQMHISNPQFERFVECNISLDDYRQILIRKGILPDPQPEGEELIPEEMMREIQDRLIELAQAGLNGNEHEIYGDLWGKAENGEFRKTDLESLIELEEKVL